MAVGATDRDVHRMILGQAVRLVCAGLSVGVLLALGVRPVVSWMGRAAALDLSLSILAVALLVAVVIAAAWLPARRATRIEPSLALNGQ